MEMETLSLSSFFCLSSLPSPSLPPQFGPAAAPLLLHNLCFVPCNCSLSPLGSLMCMILMIDAPSPLSIASLPPLYHPPKCFLRASSNRLAIACPLLSVAPPPDALATSLNCDEASSVDQAVPLCELPVPCPAWTLHSPCSILVVAYCLRHCERPIRGWPPVACSTRMLMCSPCQSTVAELDQHEPQCLHYSYLPLCAYS